MSNVVPNADKCPICRADAQTTRPAGGRDSIQFMCPRCGNFEVTSNALPRLEKRDFDWTTASAWARENSDLDTPIEINSDTVVNRIPALPKPGFADRMAKIFRMCVGNNPLPGGEVAEDVARMMALGFCHNEAELAFILRAIAEEGWIVLNRWERLHYVTPRGYIQFEHMRGREAELRNAFVAMWFADEMRAVYDNGVAPAVRQAGYNPVRVDSVEHSGKIDDRIVAEIRNCRFLIADFTGHRGGVYYEAGFAHGLGKDVFWTCRKDDLKEVHFDIRQYNFILWQNPEELVPPLKARIVAVLGNGPVVEGRV